jgi:transcription elongation factor Elf1
MDPLIRIKRMVISRKKRTPKFESLPCPECGKIKMHKTSEDCVLGDGLKVKKIDHYKCNACGAMFFDDDGMHIIQSIRSSVAIAA